MAEKRRVRLAAVGDVPAGEGRVVEAHGKTLALFNVDGAYYVIDDMCAHRGGSLGEGDLDGRIDERTYRRSRSRRRYVIDDMCAHRGGSLGEGDLDGRTNRDRKS